MRFPQTNKPPLGSLINWAHPLAKGLVGCWLINEKSGNRIIDYCGMRNATMGSTPIRVSEGVKTAKLSTDVMPLPVRLNTYANVTIMTKLNPAEVSTNTGAVLAGTTYTDGGYGFYVYSNNTIYVNVSGSYPLLTVPANYFVVGQIRTLAFSKQGAVGNLYGDGIFLTSESYTPAGCFGFDSLNGYVGGTAQFNGTIYYIYVWNRPLSAQEIAYLYAFPYAMFERRPIWMDYVAVAGGLSIPVAMRTYQNMRNA